MPRLLGIQAELVLFGLVLGGLALWHRHTLMVALMGLVGLLAIKLFLGKSDLVIAHLQPEWACLLNLLGLLTGFSLLVSHLEKSRAPQAFTQLLPGTWEGGFILLFVVFVLSAAIDNIAAALIGGTLARARFGARLHLGFLVAIVAATNAGGAGSVLGDTTTTMMWSAGLPALAMAPAVVGGLSALTFFGLAAAFQQDRLQGTPPSADDPCVIDWGRIWIVGLALTGTMVTTVLLDFPAVGVWGALLLGACWRQPDWSELPGALRGALFLLALVACASLVSVEELPSPSWQNTLVLGFAAAVFSPIPLTELALSQGGYDWGLLAYALGYGGSMLWFGSPAGVALSIRFPQVRSVRAWLGYGWHVWVGYLLGFALMLWLMGWHPPFGGR